MYDGVRTPEELLRHSAPKQFANAARFLDGAFVDTKNAVKPCGNGLIYTVMQAWMNHHILVLRPDDIWLAILAQFNLFVNANAEALRALFVEHNDKKVLVIVAASHNVGDSPYGDIAQQFATMVRDNVRDPSMYDWAMPSFSTTTPTDKAAGAVLLMSCMQEFFEYVVVFGSGLAQVTLAGTKADWEALLARVDYLNRFGPECQAWCSMLVPILSRFVRAWEDPQGEANLEFWRRIAHRKDGMSSIGMLSGWITAFCAFNDKGQFIVQESSEALTLDGVRYHSVNPQYIPKGYGDVPVKLQSESGETTATMIAGVVGMRVGSSDDQAVSKTGQLDMVAPQVGWWIYMNKEV